MKRKMGIDYGTVRIGIAISDPLGITARGIETIKWNGIDMEWAIQRIVTLIKEYSVDTVVVGLPRRTDGKVSQSEENALLMAKRIENEFITESKGDELICDNKKLDELSSQKSSIKVILKDERYTTVLANRIMRETGVRQAKKKNIVDQIAAEIILQDFLEHCHK